MQGAPMVVLLQRRWVLILQAEKKESLVHRTLGSQSCAGIILLHTWSQKELNFV